MSLYNSFDRNQHFAELNTPLQTSSGWLTPAQRKARAVANLGMTSGSLLIGQVISLFPATATATYAQIITGFVSSTTAAAVAMTLPLATDVEIGLLATKGSALTVGDGFEFTVAATGANAVTVTTNTGWTLVGSMVVATLTTGTFRVYRTAANAYTLYRL